MTGENGVPETPDWTPTPKPWPVGAPEAPIVPADVVLGDE